MTWSAWWARPGRQEGERVRKGDRRVGKRCLTSPAEQHKVALLERRRQTETSAGHLTLSASWEERKLISFFFYGCKFSWKNSASLFVGNAAKKSPRSMPALTCAKRGFLVAVRFILFNPPRVKAVALWGGSRTCKPLEEEVEMPAALTPQTTVSHSIQPI